MELVPPSVRETLQALIFDQIVEVVEALYELRMKSKVARSQVREAADYRADLVVRKGISRRDDNIEPVARMVCAWDGKNFPNMTNAEIPALVDWFWPAIGPRSSPGCVMTMVPQLRIMHLLARCVGGLA